MQVAIPILTSADVFEFLHGQICKDKYSIIFINPILRTTLYPPGNKLITTFLGCTPI